MLMSPAPDSNLTDIRIGIMSPDSGLAIVKYIVQAHNGGVVVHSTLGEGTVFTISLPTLPVRGGSDNGTV